MKKIQYNLYISKIKHLCIKCNLQCSFAHLTIIKQNCVTEYCNSEFNVLIHEFCMNDLYVNCNRCIYALMIWICKLNRIDTRHKICILHVWNWAFPTVTFPGKIFYKLLLFFLLLLLFIAINVIICYYFYIFDIWKHYSQKETRLLGP